MPTEEVGFLVRYLFDGKDGAAAASRIDRRVDRLPGQSESAPSRHRGLEAVPTACRGLLANDLIAKT